MELRRGSELSPAQLTEAWNLGYTGYFVPIYFTEAQLSQWMEAGSFDLSRSLILMDGLTPAGFSFLGVRGRRGWIGGFGIAPDYRGRGLAAQLFQQHVDLCREEGLESVQLEVLVENWAQRVYSRAGFRITRRLCILQGTLPRPESRAPVHQGDAARLLAHSPRLHGQFPPVWQREASSLNVSMPAQTDGLYAGPAEEPTGYVLFQAAPDRVRILDAAGGEAAAHALVQGLAARFPETVVSLVNEPEGSPFCRALLAAGCSEVRAQWEMLWNR
ncbi:MAG: GNAT family N-acetyltransferase [Bacillota bacterium]